MIERILKSKLIEMANKYPIVTLTGPRQSGKSTLLRNSFSGTMSMYLWKILI